MNHLHYTDRITLSDRIRDPAQGPGCVQSSTLGNRPIEPGRAWQTRPPRTKRWKAVVRQLMPADCLRGILIRHCTEREMGDKIVYYLIIRNCRIGSRNARHEVTSSDNSIKAAVNYRPE